MTKSVENMIEIQEESLCVEQFEVTNITSDLVNGEVRESFQDISQMQNQYFVWTLFESDYNEDNFMKIGMYFWTLC